MIRTINDTYLDLRAEFRKKGIAGYQIEARELVAFALGLEPEEFFGKRNQYIFDKDVARIEELKLRRFAGTPLQHITHRWEFYGLPFEVTEDTLIPRPDTEKLAEVGIGILGNRSKGRVMDLCCGTGCVGMAILKNVSEEIHGVFLDISEPALEVCKHNLVTNHLTARGLVLPGDAMRPADPVMGKFHLIVANPPYIPSEVIPTLDPEVQKEPRLALDGGKDGLDFYRAICQNYSSAVCPGGVLAFEVGIGQYEDVMTILEQAGFDRVQFACDLTGVERVVWGVWEQLRR